MAGLILFFILGVWLLVTALVAWLITKIIKNKLIRYSSMVLIIPVLFLLPVIDEILSRNHFFDLCKQQAVLKYDEKKLKNSTVYYAGIERMRVPSFIPIFKDKRTYRNYDTDEIVITEYIIRAKGGWLSRKLGVFDDHPVLTFNGVCTSGSEVEFSKLNVTRKDK